MKKFVLSLLVILLVLTINTKAQWQPCNNGLYGGTINCIAYNGSDLYAGTETGTFYSSDKGKTWEKRNDTLFMKNSGQE